jgi:hypothetical protein
MFHANTVIRLRAIENSKPRKEREGFHVFRVLFVALAGFCRPVVAGNSARSDTGKPKTQVIGWLRRNSFSSMLIRGV